MLAGRVVVLGARIGCELNPGGKKFTISSPIFGGATADGTTVVGNTKPALNKGSLRQQRSQDED